MEQLWSVGWEMGPSGWGYLEQGAALCLVWVGVSLAPSPLTTLSPQHQNFEESQESMKRQLAQLTQLLRLLDPLLCDFLGTDQPSPPAGWGRSPGLDQVPWEGGRAPSC